MVNPERQYPMLNFKFSIMRHYFTSRLFLFLFVLFGCVMATYGQSLKTVKNWNFLSWSETTLANIIKTIYSNYEVKTHYRPKWLEGLELDIYIDAIKLGIEYQGQQHYNPIKHWGGEKQLKKQKEHDSRKARICREKGVTLLTVDFDEPLTEIHIRERLKEKSLI